MRVKKRVRGGTEAMSCAGEKTAMTRVWSKPRAVAFGSNPSDLNLSLTTMSDYDIRPSGSLKLKRSAGEGPAKKCALVYP